MRLSRVFTKTKKDAPADEQAKNAQLLIQAGFIHKEMAGVYNYLPLGLKVLNNIIQVIREEMNEIGGQEIMMASLQPKDNWEKSGRWNDEVVDVWFKTRLHSGEKFHSGQELGLGNTHEEALTAIMKNFVNSYKDLPSYPYQFQTKFRNELRSKSGIMRTREFIMKDLYSFSKDKQQHEEFYEKSKAAYLKVYDRLGLGDITYITFASGGSFSKFSHEFQTLTEVGEDIIYVHEGKKLAINKEVYTDEVLADLGVGKDELIERKAVEVGNIFTLGTKYSEAIGLSFVDEGGKQQPVYMGSYGIGPGRVMGTIAEHFADEKGLVWPENIAPAKVYLARLGNISDVISVADKLYNLLTDAGVEVIYDDRDLRAGEMFADADLMGIPYRVVVSQKTVESGKHELKGRSDDEVKMQSVEEIVKALAKA
jgi:prolyl-tRNA synthetase